MIKEWLLWPEDSYTDDFKNIDKRQHREEV